MYVKMGGVDYTQQCINSRGIVVFVTDDLAYGRGDMDNTQQLQQHSNNTTTV